MAGCSNDVSDKSSEPQEEITYTYEDVDATITYIDMRKWFAICPRWEWKIEVEYEGMTYEEDDYATNAFTGVTIQPGVFMYPKVFQFPADDEI